MNSFLILFGKLVVYASRFFNLGNGSTWPGHIALSINKNFIKEIIKVNPKLKIILIAGTNGKTTTGKLIQTILEKSGKKVFQNEGGANLLNGIASSIALHSTILCALKYDFVILEVDENTLPLILNELSPNYLLILNLFRDQLDRYGEINTIAKKWSGALKNISRKTSLILNADDPLIASLGFYRIVKAIPIPDRKRNYNQVFYFGLDSKRLTSSNYQHASDSTYCPNCGEKLIYSSTYFSHLGDWKCKNCKYTRPEKRFIKSAYYPLSGMYNEYNTNAAVLFAKINNINNLTIQQSLKNFKPAFGRQEILNINEKKVQIFLSKNPTSFNESLRTVVNLKAENILIVLSDRIPDGKDISWIWDVDTEEYINYFDSIIVSGDRAYDMGLRINYSYSSEFSISNFQFPINSQISNSKFQIIEDLRKAIVLGLKNTSKNETLYILPTYSAMLEVRKILTGKKIL